MLDVANGYTGWISAFCEGLRPDPNMYVDEWADAHMIIPKKAGAPEPGYYRTDRTPYAREVMRCLSPQSPYRRVIVQGASQMLKTQVALNWIGASIHQAPANILALMPTEKIVKRVSHRIGSTIESVPELNRRVAPPRSRDSRNTIDAKEYDGGTLYIATARSASNLAEISCRYIYGDELDRWEMDVGGEGDPVELAEARTSNFGHNAKIYFSSSPLITGSSLINNLFLQSDQRHYYVPCPHCSEYQELVWEQMRWNDDITAVWYLCAHCAGVIEETRHKTGMLAKGEWRAQAQGDGQTVGFQISQLYAPLGWTSWQFLANKYAKAKVALARGDKGKMQTFYNTRLALTFDLTDEQTKVSDLRNRIDPGFVAGTIPSGALVLTFAVDVQDNRLEFLLVGWGDGLERWVIDHQVLMGRPSEPEVWAELDKLLMRPMINCCGIQIQISAGCIDTGGHHTQEVYEYARARRRLHILAVKGASRPGRPILSSKPSKVDINWQGRVLVGGAELWFVGSDTAKDWLAGRWTTPDGHGAIHFNRDLGDDFLNQLIAERRLIRYVKGFAKSEWVRMPGEPNEGLDLCVYNLAAAHYLGLHRKRDWARLQAELEPINGNLFATIPATSQSSEPPVSAPQNPVSIPTDSPARRSSVLTRAKVSR